jgi:serine/threonine-protein kinase
VSLIGQTVGNYRVIRLLGEGGMGSVYQAEHPVIGRKVAIKVLHVSMGRDPEIVARFFNEARAIHTVGHENIVEIMDFGQTPDGRPYFVMEFLAGEAMNDRLARGPIAPPEAAVIADQMCRALGAAHDKGIVHRDLKPHNVHLLVTPSGRTQVKILDFGVAKIMNAGDLSQSVKTRTGSLMGTPPYMSPEQCKGAGELDHRTDIYSLGVMLFEMLAGRPPFIGDGVGALFALHMLEPPPPLARLAPGTPPSMEAAVMRSLAKNPNDRFSTMEEFRRALVADSIPEVAQAPGGSGRTNSYRSPSGTARMPAPETSTTLSSSARSLDNDSPPPRKSRAGMAIAALVLVAGAAGTYFFVARRGTPAGHSADSPTGEAAVVAQLAETAARTAAARTVTIRFEASPAGAHVFRATDDKDLGVVPFELKLPRDGGRPEYLFRLEGYKDQTLGVQLAADQTVRPTLEKIGAPPAAPPPPPSPAATPTADHAPPPTRPPSPPRRHRARNPANADEDGLATPTF